MDGREWIAKWVRQKRDRLGSDGGASHQYSAAPTMLLPSEKYSAAPTDFWSTVKFPPLPFLPPHPLSDSNQVQRTVVWQSAEWETHGQNVTEDAPPVCKQSNQQTETNRANRAISKQQTEQRDHLNIQYLPVVVISISS